MIIISLYFTKNLIILYYIDKQCGLYTIHECLNVRSLRGLSPVLLAVEGIPCKGKYEAFFAFAINSWE